MFLRRVRGVKVWKIMGLGPCGRGAGVEGQRRRNASVIIMARMERLRGVRRGRVRSRLGGWG